MFPPDGATVCWKSFHSKEAAYQAKEIVEKYSKVRCEVVYDARD